MNGGRDEDGSRLTLLAFPWPFSLERRLLTGVEIFEAAENVIMNFLTSSQSEGTFVLIKNRIKIEIFKDKKKIRKVCLS